MSLTLQNLTDHGFKKAGMALIPNAAFKRQIGVQQVQEWQVLDWFLHLLVHQVGTYQAKSSIK